METIGDWTKEELAAFIRQTTQTSDVIKPLPSDDPMIGVGIFSGPGDLSERTEEILEEMIKEKYGNRNR